MTEHLVLALAVRPESLLDSGWYAVLARFVAINTILYVTLSIFKILPKPYLSDFVRHRGRRAETRSIYPDGHGPPHGWVPPAGSLAARDRGSVPRVAPPSEDGRAN